MRDDVIVHPMSSGEWMGHAGVVLFEDRPRLLGEEISRTGLSSEEFCLRLLNEHAVACVPGSAFGACGEGFVRMSYATSLKKLKIAADASRPSWPFSQGR